MTLDNDIGMIYLATAPRNLLTTYAPGVIRGITLPSSSDTSLTFAGNTATTSGFGKISNTQGSTLLRYAQVPVISNTECSRYYRILGSVVCISTSNGRSTCNGDSGGPLTVSLRGQNVLVGVTSFVSSAGCTSGYPAGFARVTSFLPWINNNIARFPQ